MRIDWTRRRGPVAIVAALLSLVPCGWAVGEELMPGPLGQVMGIHCDSGLLEHHGVGDKILFSDIIHQPDANWIRLSLAGTTLGKGSSIRVYSLRDGEVQFLDDGELQQWRRTTAYFNGNTLVVELLAAPGTRNRLIVDEIAWNDGNRDEDPLCGYCEEDERLPLDDTSVCRILGESSSCTGTIVDSDSHLITAGHCLEAGSAMVCQFNVPDSNGDCSINHPPVEDQFPLVAWICSNAGVGHDWAAVLVGTNNEGDRPYDRYGQYKQMASSQPPVFPTIQAMGYGDDIEDCERANILQESEGMIVDVTEYAMSFTADVTYGSSGSPILHESSQRILGLATHCPCPNVATRIDHPAFVEARELLFNGVAGDTCEAAFFAAVGENTFTTTGAVDSEFGSPDDAQCPGTYLDWENSPDIWMAWQPPSSGTLSLTTCDPDSYDTSLVVYAGSDCTSLVQVACNGDADPDNSCQNFYSAIDDLEVTALTTYYFRLGGWQAATGSGTLWIDHVPAPATGACCLEDLCYDLLEGECLDAGGTYQGVGTDCSVNPCEIPLTGACCTGLGEECLILSLEACETLLGVYQGDATTCDPNPCMIPTPIGACCTGLICQETTELDCANQAGQYLGDDIMCDASSCEPPCPADFDGDGAVDVDDLLSVIAFFGQAEAQYDMDGDGTVDVDDLLTVIATFGPC